MNRLLSRVAAGSVASVFVVAGLSAGAVGAVPLETQGPKSPIKSWTSTYKRTSVYNDNTVKVDNDVDQDADSGRVWVKNNTRVGNATSGDAKNTNTFNANIRVDNSPSSTAALKSSGGSGSGTVSATTEGPKSPVYVMQRSTEKTTVVNDNYIDVDNDVDQDARSGDVYASSNTTVGSVSSGDATNTNSSSVTIHVTN